MMSLSSNQRGLLIHQLIAGHEMHVRLHTFCCPTVLIIGTGITVMAFSSGPRSCIGQRFSLTESVCVLASIVRRYEILVPGYLEGKALAEQKKDLLQWIPRVTSALTNGYVRFRRRE